MHPLLQVAKALIGLVVLGHYPLNHHPARDGLRDGLRLLGVSIPPALLQWGFPVVFVGGTTSLALVVTSLGEVLHLLGGTAAAFVIFFIPGLMLINAAVAKRSNTPLDLLQAQVCVHNGVLLYVVWLQVQCAALGANVA